MARRTILLTGALAVLALAGCAGKGDVMTIRLQPTQSGVETMTKTGDGLTIAVTPFEDTRSQTSRLGTRTHLWGGESYFDLASGKPGEVAAQALVDYLKSRGWSAEMSRSRGAIAGNGADVTVTGKLLALSVDAKSRFGSTAITAKTSLAIQALNRADGSTVRMSLNGTGSQSMFWFEPDDAQALVNDVVSDSFGKLLQNTKVENRLLRLR